MPDARPLDIGIAGPGGMGTVHRSNYLHLEGCRVVGAVGSSPQSVRRAGEWGVPLFGSITEMASKVHLDVVDVCTPTFRHPDDVAEALDLGKNVIVEKPLALHLADARRLFGAARGKGLHIYTAQVLQFTPETRVLREIVGSGVYGKPLDAVFLRLSARPSWAQGGWLFDKEKSGLLPFDLHIHDLDLVISLFGPPVSSTRHLCGAEGGMPELFRFTYGYEGFQVVAEAGWLNASLPFTATWRVYFERAMVVNDGRTVTAYPAGGEPKVFDTSETVRIPTGINLPPTGWFHTELGHFLDCVRKNEDSPMVPEAQVLEVLRLLEEQGGQEV